MLDEEDAATEDEAENAARENYNRPWDLLKTSIKNAVEGVYPRVEDHEDKAEDFARSWNFVLFLDSFTGGRFIFGSRQRDCNNAAEANDKSHNIEWCHRLAKQDSRQRRRPKATSLEDDDHVGHRD